ncbi:MarR family winged helix-turn-helix transcriptional regulator [uncultured Bradyrhizobium sp.]|uniref:MarR family winged helix-turn-helix transcriptional regulator n=1 Tax=uncultured Bradyrhizobium sp. TaxID=199684 RepID=UPI0026054CCC|nr:MarR family winged helix-turn-helix transcriptional regulator [uncultured Bradyrhizobium sp.]
MSEELAGVGDRCAAFNIRKASRTITRLYADALAPAGLEPTQFALLVACSRQQSVAMGDLAIRLSMDSSALARNVAIMQRRGLLAVASGKDRRVRNVSISADGTATLSRALPYWKAAQARLIEQVGQDRFLVAIELMKAVTRSGEALLDHPHP